MLRPMSLLVDLVTYSAAVTGLFSLLFLALILRAVFLVVKRRGENSESTSVRDLEA